MPNDTGVCRIICYDPFIRNWCNLKSSSCRQYRPLICPEYGRSTEELWFDAWKCGLSGVILLCKAIWDASLYEYRFINKVLFNDGNYRLKSQEPNLYCYIFVSIYAD